MAVVEEDLSDTEELLGDTPEDSIEEGLEDMDENLGHSEDDYYNIEEQPYGSEKESISSRMESLDVRIQELEASIPTLESNLLGSRDVSVEYAKLLVNRIRDLEAQLAVEEEGRAQAEELNRALQLSTSTSRGPSPERRAALQPIHSPSSRGSRSTRAARLATRTLSRSSFDSRISKGGPTRRRYSFTYISTRRLTFSEQVSHAVWRQRWWGLGGATVGAAGAALGRLAVNADVKATGKAFMNLVRLMEGPLMGGP